MSDAAERMASVVRIARLAREVAIAQRESRRNPHCSNCGDTRGGPVGHEISECTWESE